MDVRSEEIRKTVRNRYAEAATRGASGCCGEMTSSCCGSTPSPCCGDQPVPVDVMSKQLGYSPEDLRSVPDGANMGLGCGNPNAIAALQEGETVLDLGSGGGLDCFLAARQVGAAGHVIGVDMTPDMVHLARENARKGDYTNVEFRLGEIEHLPVPDESVDVIMSNCVINLSPDKPSVYREAFRVLKPGGRIAISDTVATAPLPEEVRNDLDLLAGCVSGSETPEVLKAMLRDAGFEDIRITPKDRSREFIREWAPGRNVEDLIASATIEAVKPETM
jgi:arsenite methyltransferase